MGKALRLLLCLATLVGALAPARASAAVAEHKPVTVIVPDLADLQVLPFWVALGAGYFEQEGLTVQTLAPPTPSQVLSVFKAGGIPAALLTGPNYERLIAEDFPFELAANLFENDPLELVLRRDAVERTHLNTEMPLRERLHGMANLRIGVSVSARARLYSLFFSQGLDVNQAHVVVGRPEELIADFANGHLDAVYTQSPFLERAFGQDGIVIVDPASGEVPTLAKRVVVALGVTREFATNEPASAAGLVRAIARAEGLVHANLAAATAAVVRVLPRADVATVTRVVALYRKGVPATPHIDPARITREIGFLAVDAPAPRGPAVDLKRFLLPEPRPTAGPGLGARAWLGLLGVAVLVLALLVAFFDQRSPGSSSQGAPT